MVFKPDEVKSLRKGQVVNVEIDGKVMLLRRNFCGVYELFSPKISVTSNTSIILTSSKSATQIL
ncbi:hypothetical protein [Caloramator sp. Dgby_cultured_2]|uniref:hypothetical protein n=1 Tax=Caloramator sp. Dgby_cultured_2 TaxID=3029174 RepID=UPI00237DD1C0|nr:hypothetical protein [Caloramator sp. Dgby_cultured_2]WDU82696.1 hypothetical protein PWK10_14270 [Caloramator sp. Dgby_cultured_2]